MNLHNNKPIRFFAKSKPAGVLKNLMAIFIFAIVVPAFAGKKEGQEAFEKGDFETVLKVAKEFVEKGDPQGAWSLGWLYENGKAVPQDYNLAASWYTKAAEQGLSDAQSKLGWLYEKGLGVPQDYNLAASWYTQAAKQGLPEAESHLGMLYWNGQGVPQDYKLAEKWLSKAAYLGDAKAQYNLGVMYDKGIGRREDHREAERWLTKAADQGLASAQYSLGAKYAAAANYALAESWYAKAAEQGDADAQVNLGLMYENGQGVSKDYKLSYALYDLSGRAELRDALMKKMGPSQISRAQRFSTQLSKLGNFKTEFDDERERLKINRLRLETETEEEIDSYVDMKLAKAKAQAEMETLATETMLNKWIGGTEGDLIAHLFWGVPKQTYETGGVKYIVYEFTSVRHTVLTNTGVMTTPTSCKVTFDTREGKVETWKYQGECPDILWGAIKRADPNRLEPDEKNP